MFCSDGIKSFKMVQSGHSWCLISCIFHAWLFGMVFEPLVAEEMGQNCSYIEEVKDRDFYGSRENLCFVLTA